MGAGLQTRLSTSRSFLAIFANTERASSGTWNEFHRHGASGKRAPASDVGFELRISPYAVRGDDGGPSPTLSIGVTATVTSEKLVIRPMRALLVTRAPLHIIDQALPTSCLSLCPWPITGG
jgi:hypothetical protein